MNLFGPPNIKKLTEKRDVKALIKALNHKDPVIQYNTIVAMGDIKDPEFVEPLFQIAIKNRNRCERAFESLSKINDPGIVPTLLQLIEDIRKQSSFDIIESRYSDLYDNIVKTLSVIGDSRAIPEMVRILKNEYRPYLFKIAEEALKKNGDKSVSPLAQALSNAVNKETIVRIIAEIGTLSAMNQLQILVESKNKLIREAAAKHLLKNNIKPQEKKSFIYYSIAIKDFDSVISVGEISIPILYELLKEELDFIKNKEPYVEDEWLEMVVKISYALIKLGEYSEEFKNVFNTALFRSKKIDIRRIIINHINESGADYEPLLISFIDTYLKRTNDHQIDPGLLLGFPKQIYFKLFSRDNTLISKTQNICFLSRLDAYNTSNDSRVKIINAQNLLREMGSALIEYIRERIETKKDTDNLTQEFETLTNIGRLDKNIYAEEQILIELHKN